MTSQRLASRNHIPEAVADLDGAQSLGVRAQPDSDGSNPPAATGAPSDGHPLAEIGTQTSARGQTRRHVPPPEFVKGFASARAANQLSLRRLAALTGVSLGHLHGMSRGRSCPSVSVAKLLIAMLRPTPEEAAAIMAGAVPNVGRDNPLRKANRPK